MLKLLDIRQLQEAGYPFKANDLTIEEWIDLAQVKQFFNQPFQCPFIGEKK